MGIKFDGPPMSFGIVIPTAVFICGFLLFGYCAMRKEADDNKRAAEASRREVQERLNPVTPKPSRDIISTTRGGNAACSSEQYLNDMGQFVANHDRASFDMYVQTGKCIIMKDNIKVTVLEYPGFLGGVTKFSYNGTSAWAHREAINYSADAR